MVPVLVLLFVALWFILRGDLICFALLVFLVLLALRLPRLGKRELTLVLFVRLFDLHRFGFICFLFLLVSGKGCGLWLWHPLDLSLTLICGVCFEFIDLPSIFRDNNVISAIPSYFENTESPIICYKYNKSIRNTKLNFNKLVSDLDIKTSSPDSWDCKNSKFCYQPAVILSLVTWRL